MDDIKKVSIALKDVPDSERIIFKLICSVSVRTKGRTKHYILTSEDTPGSADILIRNMMEVRSAQDRNSHAYQIELSNQALNSNDMSGNSISRPLIATRVLSTLDNFVDAYLQQGLMKPRQNHQIVFIRISDLRMMTRLKMKMM